MTSEKRTAVCCLSSLNVEKYDEWEDTNIVQDLVKLLDNVLEYFILLSGKDLERAAYSASKERAIGLGTLGLHSYLQSKRIPFESAGKGSASDICNWLYADIKNRAIEASKDLAKLRGEPDDLLGSGMRNSHLLAIAPNASSSNMVGASPSIEPWNANAFNAKGRAGNFLIKNKYLAEELEKVGKNASEVWKDILKHDGSVQHLGFLSDEVKAVFKTASEIDPEWIVELAAIRQPHICQSQSLNIFVKEGISKQRMSDIHIKGWLLGVKSFYYCRAEAATKADIGTGADKPLNSVPVVTKVEFEECLSCQA